MLVNDEKNHFFDRIEFQNGAPNSPSDLNIPGYFPYTRGIHPRMYLSKPWTIRQYAGFGNAQETNLLFHEQIKSGVSGISIAFDLPTQLGIDPDDARAKYDVARIGVSVSTLNDMRILLKDIDLNAISISMTINATALIIIAMYKIVAEERGFDLKKLRGTLQNDILKEYIARGAFIFEPTKSMQIFSESIRYMQEHLPSWNPISISGYHMAEAGADAVHEVAFAIANAIEYIKVVEEAGLNVEEFLKSASFFFRSGTEFLSESAKFRAARTVWAKYIRARFPKFEDGALKMRMHVQTAGIQLTAQNPEFNIIRVTLQALGAVLGGTQSLHTNSWDEALSIPSEFASRIALATQKIITLETDLCKLIDPLGGSYAIESLTDSFCEQILKEIKNIEDLGGAARCLEMSYQKNIMQKMAFDEANAIDKGSKPVVGVNTFIQDTMHRNAFQNFRARNLSNKIPKREYFDKSEISSELSQLQKSFNGRSSFANEIELCLKAGASIGEITETLKEQN